MGIVIMRSKSTSKSEPSCAKPCTIAVRMARARVLAERADDLARVGDRAELLAEDGAPTHGWPEGVPRPAWVTGTAVAAVAEDTDGWQRVVKRVAAQLAARTADDGSVLPE